MTTIATEFGLIDFENLPFAALSDEAIGNTLAKANRFAGRTPEPFSVALHSVLVSALCSTPQGRALGLLHDAHEAFLGDIITPAIKFFAKQCPPISGTIIITCVHAAKKSIDQQIFAAWGLSDAWADREVRDDVARADAIACAAEMLMFFNYHPAHISGDDIERATDLLRSLPLACEWRTASRLWMSEALGLAQQGALRLVPSTHRAA